MLGFLQARICIPALTKTRVNNHKNIEKGRRKSVGDSPMVQHNTYILANPQCLFNNFSSLHNLDGKNVYCFLSLLHASKYAAYSQKAQGISIREYQC
jgi:hypothetical protein